MYNHSSLVCCTIYNSVTNIANEELATLIHNLLTRDSTIVHH